MHIVVNTRFLIPGKLEGIGYFTQETMRRLVQRHPEHEFTFLFDRPFDPQFVFADNVKPAVLFPPARHPLLWYWWFHFSVKRFLQQSKPHLFLSPDGYTSPGTSVPSVTVIHDLAFEHYPQQVGILVRHYYRHFVPQYARSSARVATVSEFSKQDLVQRYGLSPGKVDVVYSAAKEQFHPIDEERKQQVRWQFARGCRYFVYVGAIHPRKNVERLLMAYDAFRKNGGSEMKLLIVGRKAWSYAAVESAYEQMQFKEDVLFTGRLEVEALNDVIAASSGLFFVSLFEGFGVPVLEGMRCGVPVVCSSTTSVPEVAGDAALLVNPESVDEIAQAMKQLSSNEQLVSTLIKKGNRQAMAYSWDDTAQRLWQCCEKVLFASSTFQ